MASEIEEIVETNSSPRYVNPHNDSTRENDNYYSNSNSKISGNSDCEINCNNNGEREKDKKIKDGRKGASTRVLCWGGLTTRKSVRSSSKKKKKKNVDIKSEHGANGDFNPLQLQVDALLPDNFHKDQFKRSPFFEEFCARFKTLGSPQKRCLLSFIFFPGNTAVKKSLLVYLWTLKGFLETRGKTHEDSATGILEDLREKRFIIPVIKNCQKVTSSFKMNPDVRSAMILLGQSPDSGFDENFFSWFDGWACLTSNKTLELANPEKVKILVNVDRGSLDFKLELFSKMQNVEVLYLGRKQGWDYKHHHIDVTNSGFLKGLKNMEKLSFLSLQGISGIQELPSSISNLTSLEILDLRACYNLEKLPKEIGSLKKLTHLDISECYLLDCMPKELLSLSELQVLKGFVITDTKNKSFCPLAELSGLKNLSKLSVNLNSVNFSVDEFSVVLKFKPLLKLKITWEGKVSKVKQNKNYKQEYNEAKSKGLRRRETAAREVRSSPSKLQKLELQCLPQKTLPNWLTPENLTSLKKLYVRGGGLQSLGRIDQKWNVEVLRLKYLTQLKIYWRELTTMFPELQYLEKFKCPKATLFPCDCYGVWVKPPTGESAAQPQTTS